MDSATLYAVMVPPGQGHLYPPRATYDRYVIPFNNAMLAADITTVNRAAMWCAQLGHESVGLKYMAEIASGAAYEGRADLGNTQRGDGVRFKGRGPIQLTGRHNYGRFSQWCYSKGYITSPDYFVRNPTALEDPHWGLLAATWYWVVARPQLNAQADRGDLVAATKSINGGTNGLADRSARYKRALTFGARLLPAGVSEEDELNDADRQMLTEVRDLLRWMWSQLAGENAKPFEFTGWPSFVPDSKEKLTLVDYNRENNALLHGLITALTNAQAGQQP
jgi:predicted chitinase